MSFRSRLLAFAIIALAFALRVAWLDLKPAHFDEGVNGAFVDAMTHQGYNAYDPTNFHGPLHFYILFVSQTLFGRSLWALRMPLVLFSTASVGMMLAFRRHLGIGACLLAALAMAISPAFSFYGRYAIHESAFVFFLMLATWGLAGLWSRGATTHLWATGLGITGAVLTKETYVVHLFALGGAAAVVWWSGGRARVAGQQWKVGDLGAVAAVCAGLIVFFYSGGFLNWESVPGLWRTFAPWLATGTKGESGHEKDWWYWLSLLGRYEWPALLGLIVTLRISWRGTNLIARGLAVMSLATLAVYSAIAYKTPWCLIALAWPLHLLFGYTVLRAARRVDGWFPWLIAGPALAVSLALALQLNFRKFTDETEPYVYVQTLPDIEKVLTPLRTLVARDSVARHLLGHVVMADTHPLPWLLGDYPHVVFLDFDALPESLDAAFLLIDEQLQETIEPLLRHTYFFEPLRLRGQSDGTALLYLRVAEFRDQFPGRTPEFTPAPAAP